MVQRRVKEYLLLAKEWLHIEVAPELPTPDGFIDLFLDYGSTKE